MGAPRASLIPRNKISWTECQVLARQAFHLKGYKNTAYFPSKNIFAVTALIAAGGVNSPHLIAEITSYTAP